MIALAEHVLAPSPETLSQLRANTYPAFENPAAALSHRAYAAYLLCFGLRLSHRIDEANQVQQQALDLLTSAMTRTAAKERWARWINDRYPADQ